LIESLVTGFSEVKVRSTRKRSCWNADGEAVQLAFEFGHHQVQSLAAPVEVESWRARQPARGVDPYAEIQNHWSLV